jgi:hypothetical protein
MQDIQIALEYQVQFLPDLCATAKELNPHAAQRIIEIMAEKGCKNFEGNSSEVMKCLSQYLPVRIRNELYLNDEDISAKRIHSTKKTLAEPDTAMQLVKGARLQTAQTFRSTAKFEAQYETPQSFNGMHMPRFCLQESQILQPGGLVTGNYLPNMSMIFQPGGFEATEEMQALVSMMSGANAHPLEISSREP